MSKHTDETPEDWMQRARDRYTFALQADKADRDNAVNDTAFASSGEAQWEPEDRAARIKAHRPVLSWTHMTGFIAQIVNDGRQNKPAIKITVGDGGSKATAEMLQGRVRHIEYESNADIAYDTASEHQVMCGRGFYRVTTKYKPKSREQEIRIDRIENQFSVIYDPAAKEYDRSDADYCFVISHLSMDEFTRKYPGAEAVAADFYTDMQNPAPDWIGTGPGGQMVQIAEYWVREHKPRKCIQIAPGKAVWKDEIPQGTVVPIDADEWEEDDVTVCQYIINGAEVLDQTEWLGSWIPIIPQWGKELTVDGKRVTISLIRPAKDPQRLVNLYVSNIAEQIGQMPKTPYVVAEGQISGHEDEWENINTEPRAVVQYKQVGIGGMAAPPPQRVVTEPPIQALTLGLKQAIEAMKAACNIYDASLGARSNETSGLAIQRRQKESDVANFHFSDNAARSRKQLGRIILELDRKINSGERTLGTRAEDGKTKTVRVNTPTPYQDEDGQMVHHQMDQGDYGVSISTGPSFDSQRQESFDTFSRLAEADPDLMKVAGDLIFRNLDAPGAEQIADRLEKMLPPNLQPQNAQQQAVPPQIQAHIAQMSQQLQQTQQFAQHLHQQMEAKIPEIQAKIEIAKESDASKERIAKDAQETARVIAFATLDQRDGLARLEADLAATKHRIETMVGALGKGADQEHERAMQNANQGHEAGMAQNAQQADAEGQAADQQHQAGMAQDAQAAQAQGQQSDQEHAVAQQTSAQDAAAAAAKAKPPLKKAA